MKIKRYSPEFKECDVAARSSIAYLTSYSWSRAFPKVRISRGDRRRDRYASGIRGVLSARRAQLRS